MSSPLDGLDLQSVRKLLFTPCADKKALHKWMQLFLGLDYPDSIVDVNSNCTAMSMVWETYEACKRAIVREGEVDEDPRRYLYYSCRSGYKSLSESVIEILVLLHFERSTAHMAAVKDQSINVQKYVKNFLSRPYLRDFVSNDNKTETWLIWYVNKDNGEIVCEAEFEKIEGVVKNKYEKHGNFIKIVVASLQGTNSLHTNCLFLDEIEVMENPAAYEQVKAVPSAMGGKLPITVLTSTRKFSYGKVQSEIDEAEKTGLRIRHWNIIDLATACPPSRHLPEEPKITIYRSSVLMKSISEEEYKLLSEPEQQKYERDEGFRGCLSNCRIFSSCRSRLATHQKSNSNMLIPLSQVLSNFKTFNVSMARAELLCERPSSEGLIYPSLSEDLHKKTPAEMAELMTGETYPADFSKESLILLMMSLDGKWVAGMDFGWTHLFACVLGYVYGHRLFIIDGIARPELEPDQVIEECKKLKRFRPSIYPDPEAPQTIKALRKAGHRMLKWNKGPGSVMEGIESVRLKLKPAVGEPEMFFLRGDELVDLCFKQMREYHWKTDAAGRITNDPSEEGDDLVDACRYLVLNVFGKSGPVKVSDQIRAVESNPGTYTVSNWMTKVIQEHMGDDGSSGPVDPGNPDKKGGIKWSF